MGDQDPLRKELLRQALALQISSGPFRPEELSRRCGIEAKRCEELLEALAAEGLLERAEAEGGRGALYRVSDKGRASVKVVLTGGVFDTIHMGHLFALSEAKRLGDLLIVVVARDSTAEEQKGKRPIFPEGERRALIEAMKPVDVALLGQEGLNLRGFLDLIRPDVLAVGYDQCRIEEAVRRIISEMGLRTEVVRLPKRDGPGLASSTEVKLKVVEGWGRGRSGP
ncbi:MAG: adenylyltransferase/cytidyltransferase family protein [Candidatus Bathyarchaeia archaeon]